MRIAVLIGLLIALATCVASVMFGVRSISVEDAIAAIGGATETAEQAAAAARMPRTVMALRRRSTGDVRYYLQGITATRWPIRVFSAYSGAHSRLSRALLFGLSRPVPP